MKTYQRIEDKSQVKGVDYIYTFYDGEIWRTFIVDEITENGFRVVTPVRELMFIHNDELGKDSKYFKRV